MKLLEKDAIHVVAIVLPGMDEYMFQIPCVIQPFEGLSHADKIRADAENSHNLHRFSLRPSLEANRLTGNNNRTRDICLNFKGGKPIVEIAHLRNHIRNTRRPTKAGSFP